ncbi:MAG: NRDE family protein [Bacteroidetes bacterium]|nr:NRDE family protein [Bacteroidota bacterium]MBS1973755.1 NRDE family protein [Bacteroidota bacterium]
MCTVSFVPVNNKIIITSNRDEKHWRLPAIAPRPYTLKTGNAVFPRDPDAGGTWFAAHENRNAVVFLNGGFVKHQPTPPYAKSRGIVLLDLIGNENPFHHFLAICLHNIEPFTAIIFDNGQLYDCRWDGKKKYHKKMPVDKPHIWSSVTLYDETAIDRRRKWFEEWISKNPSPDQESILHFHQFTGDGGGHNDLLMNRDDLVFTVSITSLEIKDEMATMKYQDTRSRQNSDQQLKFRKAIVNK